MTRNETTKMIERLKNTDAVDLHDAWTNGAIGRCKVLIAHIEGLMGNMKRIIADDLYNNLK